MATPTKNPWLRMGALPRAIGVVMLLIGGVWLAQGVGLAEGSVMTGKVTWAVIGSIVAAGGAFVLWRALRTAKAAIAADPPAPAPISGETAPAPDTDPEN